jgi:hypothetical protein
MKPVVLFSCGDTTPTPWDDITNAWNKKFVNHGWWYSMDDAPSYIYHYKRDRSKLVFAKSQDEKKQFILIKDFVGENNPHFKDVNREIDMKFIMTWLNQNKNKSLGFGALIKDLQSGPSTDPLQSAIYYTRENFPDGHVVDAKNGREVTSEDEDVTQIITYFYAYRLADQPVYFIIFNPEAVALDGNVEFSGERAHYRIIDQHAGSFANQMLTPKMSKNAFPLDSNWYVVAGDKFTMDVGKLSSITNAYGIYPQAVKVMSDLKVVHEKGNKYTVHFNEGQTHGFISLRLNTGTMLDYSLIGSKNRLIYNIRIDKRFKEV